MPGYLRILWAYRQASDHSAAPVAGFSQIRAISLTRDGRTLYAANSGSNAIAVVELATGKIFRIINVGRDPDGATLAADERHLLTASKMDGTLDIVDLAAGRIERSLSGFDGTRQALAYSRDGKTAYVLDKNLRLSAVELLEGRITRTYQPVL